MTQEQVFDRLDSDARTLREHSVDISALKEKLNSAEKRIDENKVFAEKMHDLSAVVREVSVVVKHISEKFEKSLVVMERGIQNQDERLKNLEHRPAKRWEHLIVNMISILLAAAIGALIAKVGGA
jgi:hypothetical protein